MTDRELLRHTVAVIAYRGGKPLRNVPDSFPSFDSGGGQTPRLIVAHLADLIEWALSHVKGEPKWPQVDAGEWSAEVARFYAALAAVDGHLASDRPIRCEVGRLMAGPLADSINHIGQLMMLRRMAGSPVYGENYFVADIVTGRVGSEQSPPVRPF